MVRSTFVNIHDLVEAVNCHPLVLGMEVMNDHLRIILKGFAGVFKVPYYELEDFIECFGIQEEKE